jgi:hypothetical protein
LPPDEQEVTLASAAARAMAGSHVPLLRFMNVSSLNVSVRGP